jgi:hypothetical protein
MAGDSSDWKSWLLVTWGVAILIYGLWQWTPWAVAVVAVTVGALALRIALNRRRRRIQGYWIEYVSSNVVRAREGEFAIVYHEGEGKIYFYGIERPRPSRDLLFIPGPSRWDGAVEPWARGRRAVIVERLLENPIVKRCELVEQETT